MSNHTPGPWVASDDTVQARKGLVAICYSDGTAEEAKDGIDRRLADARLIAAAPDLLAALKAALTAEIIYDGGSWTSISTYDPDGDGELSALKAKIEAAIAKAETPND